MQLTKMAAALVVGTTTLTASAVAVTSVTATPADAQSVACGSREEMTERLKRSFGEAQTGLGLVSAERMLEVWSSPETGTWTILMTDPSGQSCLVAAGEAWKTVPLTQVALGEPA